MSELDFGTKPGIGPAPEAEGEEQLRPSEAETRSRRDDDVDGSLRPRSLDEFVGQRHVCEQLAVFIDAASRRGEALDHALFAGPPGLGKCVTTDTMVFTTHGMVEIGALGEVGGETWQPITRPLATLYGVRTADYFYDNGVGETRRVTTRSGYRVEGTPNHPLLVRTSTGRLEFRRLGELAEGDEVAVRIGAQVFGESTRLHVEGIGIPSLQDAARVPEYLDEPLATMLGLMLSCTRLGPGGHGVEIVLDDEDRAALLAAAVRTATCTYVQRLEATPQHVTYAIDSPRIARLLAGLGLGPDGWRRLPDCILGAPRLLVAAFLRGVFAGREHAPAIRHHERRVLAHLQLMLANMGIESQLHGDAGPGWILQASSEPASYDAVGEERLADLDGLDDHGAAARQPELTAWAAAGVPPAPAAAEAAGHAHDALPAHAAARAATMLRSASREGRAVREAETLERAAGFGMTAAGVLVAMPVGDGGEGYRRGSSRADDIRPVTVRSGARVQIDAGDAVVSVSEVEPCERGRALVREHDRSHETRALAVRSVRSRLRADEMVELAWEPVASIEVGRAHTVDVSVPDGHTFVGNGIVCHNTTLANVVANELGSTMCATSGPALEKKADVAAILTSLGPRDVLFIDEIHRLPTPIEEVLYTAMEDFQIDLVLGQGPAARTLRLDIEPFTLVGATTRTGLLTTPLRDRFGITQRLELYSTEELTSIVLRSARLLELGIDDGAAIEIAGRSRGTPRIANRLLRRVRDVAQVRHDGHISLEVAREALDLVDIDAEGLDRVDRMVLETILMRFGGGPVGLSTLSVAIGEEQHTLEDVYEPFLLQRGFIQRTPRGRVITLRGRAHLGAPLTSAPLDTPGLF